GIVTTLPRRLHVKPGTLQCLPLVADACADKPLLKLDAGQRFYALDPVDLGFQWRSITSKVDAMFFLLPDFERSTPQLVRLSEIEMVKRLIFQATSGHHRLGPQARQVCSVVRGIPCFELRVGPLELTANLVQNTMRSLGMTVQGNRLPV